jgi:hypothetical protein
MSIETDPLPVSTNSVYYLNGDAGMERAADFQKFRNVYVSPDPRTIDVLRNMRIPFDHPPYQTPNTQPQEHIYSSRGSHTGFYPDYPDIHAGQIRYYTNVQNADPYETPPYVIPSTVIPTLLQDPMGGLRPYYEKIPLFQHNNFLSEYTFDQDQMQFREDLMSKQQQKINSQKWDTYQLFHRPDKYFNIQQ